MSARGRLTLSTLLFLWGCSTLGCSTVSGLDDYRVGPSDGGAPGGTGGMGGMGGSVASCLPGDVYDEVGGSCFRYVDTPRQWAAARVGCSMVVNGDLAALSTSEELSSVLSLFPVLAGGTTWLGGTDMPTEGVWRWTNGELFTYALGVAPWNTGEPNDTGGTEECLELLGNGRFNDQTCSLFSSYLCEYAPTES